MFALIFHSMVQEEQRINDLSLDSHRTIFFIGFRDSSIIKLVIL